MKKKVWKVLAQRRNTAAKFADLRYQMRLHSMHDKTLLVEKCIVAHYRKIGNKTNFSRL